MKTMCDLNLPDNWRSLTLTQQLDWFDAVHATVRVVPQKVARPAVIHLPYELENKCNKLQETI